MEIEYLLMGVFFVSHGSFRYNGLYLVLEDLIKRFGSRKTDAEKDPAPSRLPV